MAAIILRSIQNVKNELNSYLYNNRINPFLDLIEQKIHVERSIIALGILGLLAMYLVVGWGNDFVCNFIGILYPVYASLLAVRSPRTHNNRPLLIFWIVYSSLICIEYLAHDFFDSLHFYWLAKNLFLVWFVRSGATKVNGFIQNTEDECNIQLPEEQGSNNDSSSGNVNWDELTSQNNSSSTRNLQVAGSTDRDMKTMVGTLGSNQAFFAGGGDWSMFGLSLEQLKDLMALRGKDLVDRINTPEFNGLAGVLEKLKVDPNRGLDTQNVIDLEQRRVAYGRNELPPIPMKSFLQLCWYALLDVMLIGWFLLAVILIGLALYFPPVNNGVDELNLNLIEGIAILIPLLVTILVGASNNWRKEREFRRLQNETEKNNKISVIRNNCRQQISIGELVVGDICFIETGDTLPANGLLVQVGGLKIDESCLTGETNLITKNEVSDIGLLSGTEVKEGNGQMIVIGVGLNSQMDMLMNLLDGTEGHLETEKAGASVDEEDEGGDEEIRSSGLQMKLAKVALPFGYFGFCVAGLVLICLIVRFCLTNYVVNGRSASGADVSYFITFLLQAITVFFVSTPEGLPLTVTLALDYAIRKMTKGNIMVRHLDACETMANTSTLCCDKTQLLINNRMAVVEYYITGRHYERLPNSREIDQDLLPLIFESISVNTNYTSKIESFQEVDNGLPKLVGNKTECALLALVLQWGGSYDQLREQYPENKLVRVYKFNSQRKMMSTIIKRDNSFRVYTKGASEAVLTKCKYIINENGQSKELNDNEKTRLIQDIVEKMGNDGLRTICVAYRDLDRQPSNFDDEENIVTDLTAICIVGVENPVRPEVPLTIARCQRAGVVVRMITGDNIATARSIATKCGILKQNDNFLVLEGKEFNERIRDFSGRISQKQLDEIWPNLRVLARAAPQDKYNLVNGIIKSRLTLDGEVVAVVCDGTNDVPVLKRADVGFATTCTDLVKQASDIFLTDDNFSSVVKVMMYSRNIHDCIAKYLRFQLTVNLSVGLISLFSAVVISSVPLRAIQMLWINLAMSALASLALATELPTEDLLDRKPYCRTKSIISPMMLRSIIGHTLYQLTIMFVILYTGQYFLDVESTVDKLKTDLYALREPSNQFTMVFNSFVLMTLFNEVNSRKLNGEKNVFKGIFDNPLFCCIWFFCFGAQILIVSFGGVTFNCYSLNLKQWSWSLLFGVGSLIWEQIINCIPTEPFAQYLSNLYRRRNQQQYEQIQNQSSPTPGTINDTETRVPSTAFTT